MTIRLTMYVIAAVASTLAVWRALDDEAWRAGHAYWGGCRYQADLHEQELQICLKAKSVGAPYPLEERRMVDLGLTPLHSVTPPWVKCPSDMPQDFSSWDEEIRYHTARRDFYRMAAASRPPD